MLHSVQWVQGGRCPGDAPAPERVRANVPVGADPDHFLVLQVSRGDPAAFDRLVEKYRQPILSFASRTLGDPVEAQDVAQNVFMRAFRESGRFRFASKVSTWLYAIARNLCCTELRRRSRQSLHWLDCSDGEHRERAQRRARGSGCAGALESLFQAELQEKVVQALAALPERQRAAMRLLVDKELCYEEIASILGTSLSATKTLIYRGRQTLKRKLRPYVRGGFGRNEHGTSRLHRGAGRPHALRAPKAG
jgi:RNA polymerase sigma-70 factor (ECF subfamily)